MFSAVWMICHLCLSNHTVVFDIIFTVCLDGVWLCCLLFVCVASCSVCSTCFVSICGSLSQYAPLQTTWGRRSTCQAFWRSLFLTVTLSGLKKKMSLWLTFNFLLMTFLQNFCQKMSKQPVQSSKQPENRFALKNQACQAPHCCNKSASAYGTCPVWIISQLSLQRLPCPCFLRSESWSASN